MARVRVRGITATATTKLLLDRGHVIVQASRVIQGRLGIPLNTAPADVTVKDGGLDELVVIGFPREAEDVLRDLVDSLRYVFVWKPCLNLYSVVVARVVEKAGDRCVVELPRGCGGVEVEDCRWEPGRLVTLSIVKPAVKPWEKPRVASVIRVVGEYVSIIYGSQRLSISEHIRDPVRRRELLAVATAAVMGRGLGVHIRSSAAYADPETIAREIKALEEKLRNIIAVAREAGEPSVIYEGELVAVLSLSRPAKEILDKLRSTVVATVNMHHSLKAYGGCLSDIVDYAEVLADKNCPRELCSKALWNYITAKLSTARKIELIHIKPDGRTLKLTPGTLETITEADNGYTLRLKRVFRKPGRLDALDIEKNPGDYSETIIHTDKWYIIHNYYRKTGEYIGTYININTPPEILPDQIKYHDLLVDIIKTPGGEMKVVDKEELDEYHAKNIIPEPLYKKALETIEEIMKTQQSNK